MISWVNTSECACRSAAMERRDSPAKAALALNCVIVLLAVPSTCLGSYPTYKICPPVQLSCGEKSIQSVVAPFRTDDQPESCGRKSFRLFCYGEYPAIWINSAVYWVKDMDYQTLMLTLVNVNFLGSPCRPTFTSTKLDVSPFAFTFFVQKVSIYYDCSCRDVERGFVALPCPADASGSSAYLTTESHPPHPYWGCSCHGAVIHAAIHQSEFENLTKRDSIDPANLKAALIHGFQVVWPDAYKDSDWCGACKTSGGNCTYDQRWPAGQSCSCQGGLYSPVCPSQGEARWGMLTKKAIIGITLGSGGLLVVLCLIFHLFFHFYCRKMFCRGQDIEARRKLKRTKYIEAFLKRCRYLAPKKYSYSELMKMTNSFSDMIGRGGFAEVFKGKLNDGRSVAVKVLCKSNSKSNGRDFVNEVASMGWTYHVNIVSLLGYCSEDDNRALIYEFMPNGSLDRFIFGDKRGTLGWSKLYEIAVGIARGLEYLHRGCEMSIFHLDIKPHNILLDEEFHPKISDFGLAKLCAVEKSDVLISCGRGTIGYMSPEARNPTYGKISSKSDVYSFGKMVLGMVGGKSNIDPLLDHTSEVDYPHWICRHLNLDGKFEVHGTSTEDDKLICRRMIMVGFWCIQINPAERPSINKVVAMLEGRIEDLHMPPYCILQPMRSDASHYVDIATSP